ncbi:FAD-binding oxidoreductase [Echinicola marina]|uniref:FAD-dependent oxidoreductase n=1 Tax=Echinicola marina TaxID=2859768 RepID=UPI001CF6E526|nr:FAD-dependent oxidoreductase [Echinicola marina]UCS95361.1 FAD-binding oxidoreductase [Echinicola marina]
MKNERRDFIKKATFLGLSTGLGIGACTSYIPAGTKANFYINTSKGLPPVKVSRKRVIKESVGLRPFRKIGPRVELQELGNKKIVHNYGHGGSGWSLSWGTSKIAADLIDTTPQKEVAVIGCGIIGLSTARTLQDRGYQVTIYTKEVFPQVTSAMATGTWSPTSRLILQEHITPAFKTMFQNACSHSFNTFQRLLGINQIVNWMDNYHISSSSSHSNTNHHKFAAKDQLFSSDMNFYPEPKQLEHRENPFKAKQVHKSPTTIFNIPIYMKMLRDDFLLAGGKLEFKTFKRPEDIDALSQKCIANCTGLGSLELFGDEEMMPISGQLCFLIPQPELNYRASMSGVYFIPRKDGIMLGGNGIENNWNTIPDKEVTDRYLEGVTEMMNNMKG